MGGIRFTRRLGLAAALAVAAAVPVTAQRTTATSIVPYLEVQQVVDADLDHGGDTVTYTTLAAGIDGSVTSRRVSATINYRYERRIPWNKHFSDEDIHTGLARASVQLVPQALSLEGGAIATRTRSDIRGAAPLILAGDVSNITQVYGGYLGPTLNTRTGPFQIGASYQLGYVRADNKGRIDLAPGQPRLDVYDHATSQNATASIGMPTGTLPFGWTVSGGWAREDVGQLDQRYDAKNARVDVVVPVSRTLAITGGVGYEDIEIGQRLPLRDSVGLPVVNSHGRYVADKSTPRVLAYDSDGLIYDAGVIWRPNRRTTLIAKAGHRYGGTIVVGSLDWRVSRTSGVQVQVYDGIQSFGRLLTQDLNSLPTGFTLPNNPLLGSVSGCVFGTTPGTGGCLNDAFQSVNTDNFRSRGVTAIYTVERGPWGFGVGGGYAERKYIAPVQGNLFTLNGIKDRSWLVQAGASRTLSAQSGVNAELFAQWFDSGIPGAGKVTSEGATASYYHNFNQRLSAQASAGIYTYDQDGFDSDLRGQLLLGVRYQF